MLEGWLLVLVGMGVGYRVDMLYHGGPAVTPPGAGTVLVVMLCAFGAWAAAVLWLVSAPVRRDTRGTATRGFRKAA